MGNAENSLLVQPGRLSIGVPLSEGICEPGLFSKVGRSSCRVCREGTVAGGGENKICTRGKEGTVPVPPGSRAQDCLPVSE